MSPAISTTRGDLVRSPTPAGARPVGARRATEARLAAVRTWWASPRNRRIALVTGVLLVLVWTVALVVPSRSGGSSRRHAGTLTLEPAGRTGRPGALWLFGFDTLRLDPERPSRVERLGRAAFGDIAGREGGVLLYEPGNGRFGFLDATRNRIVDETALPAYAGRAPLRGTVAGTPAVAWVVTGPGRVLRHPLPAGPDTTVDVAPSVAPTSVLATRVAADANGGWAVTTAPSPSGPVAEVTRLDADRGIVAQRATVGMPTTELVDVLRAGDALWLVTPNAAIGLDPTTLRERRRETLDGTGAVLAATAQGDTLWYATAGGELGRIDVRTRRNLGVTRRFALQTGRPFVRLGATAASVWALVGTNQANVFRSELVRFDAAARPVFHLNLPSSLAIAELAISAAPGSGAS